LGFIWLPASLHTSTRGRRRSHPRRMEMTLPQILPLVVAMGIGTAAATAIGVYLVPTAVKAGVPLGTAGWLLVWGSMAGVVARLAGGWLADHRGSDGLGIIAGMLVIGAAGYAAFALEDPLWIVAATIGAYAFGWGWTGLMNYAVVRLNPGSPATAAGVLQTGGAAGAAVGPILFGQILSHTSYPIAWLASAAGLMAAAGLILALKSQLSSAA
jgi:cyanate permease